MLMNLKKCVFAKIFGPLISKLSLSDKDSLWVFPLCKVGNLMHFWLAKSPAKLFLPIMNLILGLGCEVTQSDYAIHFSGFWVWRLNQKNAYNGKKWMCLDFPLKGSFRLVSWVTFKGKLCKVCQGYVKEILVIISHSLKLPLNWKCVIL